MSPNDIKDTSINSPPQKPAFDEKEQQQLLALVGRVTDTEDKKASKDDVNKIDSSVKLVANAVPTISPIKILTKDFRLTRNSPALLIIDCNGGNRTVKLPNASEANKSFTILNRST